MGRCLPATSSSTCLCQGAPCDVASTRRVDAHTLFDEARIMVLGLRWLCSLMHTSGSRSIFRAGLPWAPTTQIGLLCRLLRTESTPTRCSTSRQKFNRAKRASVVNRGARTGLKHRAWRSRHNVERDMSSELCRRSTLTVCRGVSVTATSISVRTSLVRHLFSGRDLSGAPRRNCLIFVLRTMLCVSLFPDDLRCERKLWILSYLYALSRFIGFNSLCVAQ